MSVVASSVARVSTRTAGIQAIRFSLRGWLRCAAPVFLLWLGLLTAAGAADAAGVQGMERVATAHRSSLALVIACRPNGAPTDCRSSTAFSVGPGLFVTVRHALLGSSEVTLSTLTHGTVTGHIVASDSFDDIVLLRGSLVLPPLQAATTAVAGERAVVVCSRRAVAADGLTGRPANYAGRIGGAPIRVDQGDRELLLERVAGAASVVGCSGSPVLDQSGAVTGVLVGGDGGSAGIVDASRLESLIGRR